jgi:predicted dithiol-disulfide oxidoreductase (DUF899 family)
MSLKENQEERKENNFLDNHNQNHKIVSKDEWIKARIELLVKEKEFTHLREQINQNRRDLPWIKVNKEYIFDGPKGKQTLSSLFDGKSQLIIYHFMFSPSWEAGCPHCSFWADNFDNIIIHLNQRDVNMIAVSRAPYDKIDSYKKRMEWNFDWVSSFDNDFNFDYHVSFTQEELVNKKAFYNYTFQDTGVSEKEGISVFYKNIQGQIFHTYSTFERGIDDFNLAYHFLDIVPKGRDENGLEFPQSWVHRHDEYIKK